MDYQPKNFTLPEDGVHPKGAGHDHPPYVFNDAIAVAVDVALTTSRPLLISGPPGSGKSTLAPVMAERLGWRYLHETFTSRTRLEDLTGDLDQLRRLNDAQVRDTDDPLPERWAYLEPGILWWAYDRRGAVLRGRGKAEIEALRKRQGNDYIEPLDPSSGADSDDVVILLDEVDKADPDLPNDLLEPLDRRRFGVPQGPTVKASPRQKTLVVITTNEERELPPAFLRRCISLRLDDPDTEQLLRIARYHYPRGVEKLHRAIAERLIEQREAARNLDIRPPSSSEYLDAIEACRRLKIRPGDAHWSLIEQATFIKETTDDGD